MAKLKATPKNFEQAKAALAGRDSMRLGNNTYLETYVDSNGRIDHYSVRLHSTSIVIFHADGRVTLHTGGYRTVTTKERINQFVRGRLWQKAGAWFYSFPLAEGAIEGQVSVIFSEGLNVNG